MKDIQDWIASLIEEDDILKISKSVDPDLEISQIVDLISKGKKVEIDNKIYKNPALYFSNPKNSSIPLVINLFGTLNRIELALGRKIKDIEKEIEEMIQVQIPKNFLDGLKFLPKMTQIFKTRPHTVKNAACQELVFQGEDIDLYQLPILKCWPKDADKFITLNQVISKNIQRNQLNFGMYRLQIIDKKTTAMHWHKHHDGASSYSYHKERNEKMEVAVVLGGPPSLIYAASAPLPPFIDEMTLASFISKKSIAVTQAKTIDMKVPADAEIILEGYVDPNESLFLEGPFGDHTGYYSEADYFPRFHITAITMKKDPIYPSIIVGKPPMEDLYLGKLSERIFLPPLRLFIPEILDIAFPAFGTFHNFVFVSIRKKYPFQAKKVMNAIWGMGQLMLSKFIVVVDDDVDVQNTEEVLWRLANNVDPKRDVLLSEGPLDQLDHSSPFPLGGSKMGFDATKRFREEGYSVRLYPEEACMSLDVQKKIDSLWNTLFEKF